MYKDELINNLKLDTIRMIELTFNDLFKVLDSIKKDTKIKINDDEIDEKYVDIESLALKILLKEQMYSKDLRIVTGILKLVDDIERIGDHSEDLVWCASKFTLEEKLIDIKKLNTLTERIKDMTSLTLKAFLSEDKDLAETNMQIDDEIDSLYLETLDELESFKDKNEYKNLIIYSTLISKYLERVGDHLVNINEWIIYIKNGEYKGKVII